MRVQTRSGIEWTWMNKQGSACDVKNCMCAIGIYSDYIDLKVVSDKFSIITSVRIWILYGIIEFFREFEENERLYCI